jgi:acetyl-CoA carboxylase carboxyltransferase component
MGANQAAGVLAQIQMAAMERRGDLVDEKEREAVLSAVRASYEHQADIRYGAAHGWVDRIIAPENTRTELIDALRFAALVPTDRAFQTGVLQV